MVDVMPCMAAVAVRMYTSIHTIFRVPAFKILVCWRRYYYYYYMFFRIFVLQKRKRQQKKEKEKEEEEGEQRACVMQTDTKIRSRLLPCVVHNCILFSLFCFV